ncbi:dehydrogenase [Candidatus Poribacteria bacterium]|nr:dehydrogenase [Candidatus Poribacteria bacterium]
MKGSFILKHIGVIGLGNMGMAMANNIIKNGFGLVGYDLDSNRLQVLKGLGGEIAHSPKEVGRHADAVFVMVLNGEQVYQVVAGNDGLLESMEDGSSIIVTATIEPKEIREVAEVVFAKGINLIDSPVSGGKSGAEDGTLTMMAAAPKEVFDANQDVLRAVGKNIFHVGEEMGLGQTVKGALQAFIGASFTAIFESLVLGIKAGVEGETLFEVFSSSAVGSPLFRNCAQLIMDRQFENTGSHIGTMYKDLGISMAMAKENGVPMFTTAAAYELFQSGISLFPDQDNWSIVKLLEQIADTKVTR